MIIFHKTFLFHMEQLTLPSPQENSNLNPKFHIFHYFFAKKSYLNTVIQSKLVTGTHCTYDPISLSFQFFLSFVQICEIRWETLSISHKNRDPSPLQVQKGKRMKYDSQTKRVSSHSVMIRHETHMSLKSH